MTDYNPFTQSGRYNIKNYIYQNKSTVETYIILIILLLVSAILLIWFTGRENKPTNNILPPIPKKIPEYGYGPFGYGLYSQPLN